MRLGVSRRRLAWLAVLITVGLLGWLPAAPARAAGRPTVVVLAVPGLQWADVASMPNLSALVSRSAAGELSVKTQGLVTRCAAGLIAVSAGNRTTAPTTDCEIDMSGWPALRQANHRSRYDANVGDLGATLQAAGVKTVAVTPAAEPMLADTSGRVDTVVPNISRALAIGGVVGVVDTGLYAVPNAARSAARTAVDARVGGLDRLLPPDVTLMVAGISDLSTGASQLHPVVVSGPGWIHSQLRSSAAGRAPYVQLIDIAPTVLAAEGISEPSDMVGRSMRRSGSTAPSIASFIDDNHHAVAQRSIGQRVFLIMGIVAIVMMILAAGPIEAGRQVARWLARLLAPAPAIAFIANAFPWWRWGQIAYGGMLLGGCLLVAAVTTLAARRSQTAALLVAPVFSAVVLAVDQLTGSTLQLSSPLGDNPIGAGRFSGMGNLDFAVFATSALLAAGVVGGRLRRGLAIAAVSAIAIVAIVIDGAPRLGNDIGGVLALVPAAIVVVALVARVRITKLGAAAVALITVVVAVGVALADYSRPPADQTHVGRFVGQVLHGGAGTEVHRKLDAALASFGLTTGTFVVGFAVVVAVAARRQIGRALAASDGVRAGAIGVLVMAALGVSLNDSGVTIAAMAVIVGVSAVYGSGISRRSRES